MTTDEKLDKIREMVHKLDVRMARLETALSIKSGIIGFIAGAIPALIVYLK